MNSSISCSDGAIDSKPENHPPTRRWMYVVGGVAVVTIILLLLTTSGPSAAKDGVRSSDVSTTDFPLDGGAQLICFHTNDRILATVIAQPPTGWLSCDMHSEDNPTHRVMHFNWDGTVLDVRQNLVDIDRLSIGDQNLSLEKGRVVFWNGANESITQKEYLKSELRPNADTPQEYIEPFVPLLKRINTELMKSDAI